MAGLPPAFCSSPTLSIHELPVSNPYQPPSTIDTPALSQRSFPTSWIALLAVCALIACATHRAPYVTVIAMVVVGAIMIPFIKPAVRRKRIWGFVLGLALAIVCPVVFLSVTMEPPNTYATVDAFNHRLGLILAFTIPIGTWAGVIASAWPPKATTEQ
jgi:hypothetical protein